ncbi:putative DNA-binding pseudobarrel domain superfamily [Helianthus anomalus]
MDPLHKSPSFLKLIEEDFQIFLQIPNDFASMIWGDQPPYKDSVKIVDGNKLWFVRVKKKTDVGPILVDGFTKVVRDSCVRKDDYLMFQSYGQVRKLIPFVFVLADYLLGSFFFLCWITG